jgi:hypothetical protein
MVYMGVMTTQADWGGKTETWNTMFDRFVEFQSPRMMAAGKLALRGVRCNSYPLSMSHVSKFTELVTSADSRAVWNNTTAAPAGWAPIMVYNPQGIGLEYLVTIEWRVRFDLTNPASSGHVHHPVASESAWDNTMKAASSLGNGVREISEVVANIGAAAETLRPILSAM